MCYDRSFGKLTYRKPAWWKIPPRFHRVVDGLFNELKVIGICQGVIRTLKKGCVRGEINGYQHPKIFINVEVGLMKER